MKQCNYKIAVIIVFFGKWPEWIHHFLNICNQRSELHFLIFSDNELPERFNNVFRHKLNQKDISALIKQKTGINILLPDAYKLCDFKPAYGKIFEDYLQGYDYWAYSDIDLFYGNLIEAGLYKQLEENDVVSLYPGFASGPLCFYRNREDINELFRQVKAYKTRLESSAYQGFDEHIVRKENIGVSIRKVWFALRFLPQFLIGTPACKRTLPQFKYDFQWFVKRLTLEEPTDISEAILINSGKGKLTSIFMDVLTNDADYYRNKIEDWEIVYNNGRLFDIKNNEHLVFHFIESKKSDGFSIENSTKALTRFKINRHGIKGF